MPCTPCRERRIGPGGEAICARDGWPCPESGPGRRNPDLCPRFGPGRAPCPLCLDTASPCGPPNLLLESPLPDGGARYACPACGYLADAQSYARDLLATLETRQEPKITPATIPCVEAVKKSL